MSQVLERMLDLYQDRESGYHLLILEMHPEGLEFRRPCDISGCSRLGSIAMSDFRGGREHESPDDTSAFFVPSR